MNLLKRLLPSQDIDALLGDIVEESRRRSRLWYWAQIIAVLVVASWKDVRAHKWLAARAIAIGLASLTVLSFGHSMLTETLTVLSNGGYMLGGHWITLPFRWPPRQFFAYVGTLDLMTATSLAASGWVVGRLHRGHGVTMVLAYLFFVMLVLIPVPLIILAMRRPSPLPMYLGSYAYYAVLNSVAETLIVVPASILLGGLWGARQPDDDRVQLHGAD